MIGLPQSVKILLFTIAVDMRKGFDGLSALVVAAGEDVYSGHLFVFVSRRRERAKILMFQKGGFVLWYNDNDKGKKKHRSTTKGRRKVDEMGLPKVTVSLPDPVMEKLVEAGQARRLQEPEVSCKVGRKPAEYYCLEIARTTYATRPDENGRSEMFTAEMPPELLPRCLAAPSPLAEIITDKLSKGLPLYRQEQELFFEGNPIDRGSMSRWLNQLGSRFYATIVAAMEQDAMANAFCIATDATGFAVQPGKRDGGPRRPCRKGHYFVRIADRDHILFNFTDLQRSEDVVTLFKGYAGHIQADACSVYNARFRPSDPDAPDEEDLPTEVGCWSHARRKFFEAAFAKLATGREGLVYLHKIFEIEQRCRAGKPPPSTIKARRLQHLAPLIDEFVRFAQQHYEREKKRRGPARACALAPAPPRWRGAPVLCAAAPGPLPSGVGRRGCAAGSCPSLGSTQRLH